MTVTVGTDLVTFGETMALFGATDYAPCHRAQDFTLGIAGSESNVAIGVSRLGGTATWLGRVGDDELGELILRELRAEGVQVMAHRDPSPTAMMVKFHRTQEQSRVLYYRHDSAGAHLSPADLDEATIRAGAVLHVTGITPALGKGPAATVQAAIEIARGAEVPVSLDLNYRSSLWRPEEAGKVMKDLLGSADIVFAGEHEAALVTSERSPRAAAKALADSGALQVIIKLGDRGSVALIDGAYYERPAHRVAVTDAVGAGDAFVAGYLADLIDGRGPEDRLSTATTAAAYAIGTRGDWEGLPTRREITLLAAADQVLR